MMIDPLIALIAAAVAAGVVLGLFWPDRGLFWRWRQAARMTRRVLMEDTLKHLHDCEYVGRTPFLQSIAGALQVPADDIAALLPEMQARGLVQFDGDRLELTAEGRDYARHIIRAHRLWEHYLAEQTGYAEGDWHSLSERREHELSPAETDALSVALGHPLYDPHGDPIPTTSGDLMPVEQVALPNFPLNKPARIVHLEDEPETVYAQLVAEGLHPNMQVQISQITPQRIRFWAGGDEHVLAPVVAANISVAPLKKTEQQPEPGRFELLNQLKPGETARVVSISPNSRGAERRRFMDLGILPGTTVTAELISPSGDPTAYRVRGALIGLRREQAGMINISRDVTLSPAQVMEVAQ
jgi:DtxR family Mn-dependent transcriptional regulator